MNLRARKDSARAKSTAKARTIGLYSAIDVNTAVDFMAPFIVTSWVSLLQ